MEVKKGDALQQSWTTEGKYKYNAIGNRCEKVANSTTTRYIYDGVDCVADMDSSNNIKKRYLTTFLDENVVMFVLDGEDEDLYYYLHDGLGSVRNLLAEDKSVQRSYTYTAFGEPLNWDAAENAPANRYTYTGREWDSESQSYYFRLRQCFPSLGRFGMIDPLAIVSYVYGANSPQAWIDPFGTDTWKSTIAATETGISPQLDPNVKFTGLSSEQPLYQFEYKIEYECKMLGGLGTEIDIKVKRTDLIPKYNRAFISGELTFVASIPIKIPVPLGPVIATIELKTESVPGEITGECGMTDPSPSLAGDLPAVTKGPGILWDCRNFYVTASVKKRAARVGYKFIVSLKVPQLPQALVKPFNAFLGKLPVGKDLPIGHDLDGKIRIKYQICCLCVKYFVEDGQGLRDEMVSIHRRLGKPETSGSKYIKWDISDEEKMIELVPGQEKRGVWRMK